MKINRTARFAARLGVVAMLGTTIMATQVAPAHAIPPACSNPTLAPVCQRLADIIADISADGLPDTDPYVDYAQQLIEITTILVTSAADTAVETALDTLESCRGGGTCAQLIDAAKNVIISAVNLAIACAGGQNATCNTVRQVAMELAQAAIDLAVACVGGQNATCNTAKATALAVAQAAIDLAAACAAGQNATCNQAKATALAAAATAAETAGNVIADAPDTVNDAVAQLGPLAGQVVSLAGFVVGLAGGAVPDTSTSGTQVATPVLVDIGETTTSPEFIDLWDVADDPNVGLTPEQTTFNATGSVEQSAIGLVGDQINPLAPECTPQWHYEIDRSRGAKRIFKPAGTRYSLNNDDDVVAQISIEKSQITHVGITVSAGIEGEAGVILAKVRTTFGVSVNAGRDWSTTQGYTRDVAPHRLGHLAGGAIGYKTMGHYWHTNRLCQTDYDKPLVTIFTPSVPTYGLWSEPAVPTEP